MDGGFLCSSKRITAPSSGSICSVASQHGQRTSIRSRFALAILEVYRVGAVRALSRTIVLVDAAPYCDGLPSEDDPANTLRPSGNVTFFAFAILDPSLAAYPSTVTWSPIFSESCRQPKRVRIIGGPNSMFQLVTFP